MVVCNAIITDKILRKLLPCLNITSKPVFKAKGQAEEEEEERGGGRGSSERIKEGRRGR